MRRIITYLLFVFLFSGTDILRVSAQTDCNCWPTRDTSFHPVPFAYDSDGDFIPNPPYYRCDDGVSNPIVLPFHFCFWGREMDTIFINTNGNLSFFQPYSGYVPDTFPITNYAMIAPFWADVDTRIGNIRDPNLTLYQITAHHMIVQWDSVRYYDCTDPLDTVLLYNSFEVVISDGTDPIIPKGNNVEFCYKQMQWTTGDASSGTNGFGGDPATVGANQGDAVRYIQIGLFDTAGSGYLGQFPPAPSYDGVSWLDNKSFLFNLCSGSIAPLISGVSPCDTFRICLGDSLTIPIYFYSPVQGDSVWSNLLPPIPSGVSIVYNKPGPTDSILIKVIGNSSNVGYHTINAYGWDNQIPPDTTFTSFVIEVDTAPKINVHAVKDTICAGDTSTLTASGAKLYLWSTGQTTSSIKVAPTTTQYYTVGGSNGGCDKDTLIQVVVLPAPAPTITVKPDTICARDSVLLIAGGGGPYRWSTGQTKDSIWVNPAITTNYFLTSTNGYCTDSVKTSVFVTAPGTTKLTIAYDSICPFAFDTLTASGGTAYKWSNGATTSSIIVNPGIPTTYTVISTVTCTIDTLRQTVKIIPLPVPKITGRLAVCATGGDTITISGGTSYIWSNGTSGNQYIFKNINADSTISVEVFNGKCHVDTSINIGIKAPPYVIVNPPAKACVGSPVLLSVSDTGSGPFTYLWKPGNSRTDTVTVRDTGVITYTVYVSNGCTSSKTTTVIPDIPPLNACCDKVIIEGDDTVINSYGNGIIRYQWIDSSNVKCLNPPHCDTVKVSPTVTTTYTVIGTDSLGCQTERIVTITVEIPCFDYHVPNVFTPNGDGRNDDFYVTTRNLEKYQIYIYDRWGKEVYKSTDPMQGWNGDTESGGKAPTGVYYYIITSTCQGNTYNKNGFLQLIR